MYMLNFMKVKFGYNACCHWLNESALSEHKAESWAKAVTPSAKLYFVWPFQGLLSSFFSSMESEILEQTSRWVGTEEPNKVL